MTLYLKYRSQTINELDLENVRLQLTKIVSAKDVPHAFLFSGPKGTGKTSAARILAKIINCTDKKDSDTEPCNKCDQCMSITRGNNIDVVEIDAASNRGIDDIRSLKESIMLSPSTSKKKIYIIDEAHMLTTEAANAFLKTLEEPPDHVVFILATTDAHKLPETVISRLTRVDFLKARDIDIKRQLERVIKGEKIEIDDETIGALTKIADGSFRDAIKTLEHLITNVGNKIKFSDAQKVLLLNKSNLASDFLLILLEKDSQKILEFISKIVTDGVSLKPFIDSLIEESRKKMVEKQENERKELIYLIELLFEAKKQMPVSVISELPLEIAVIKFCQGNITVPVETVSKTEMKIEIKQDVSDVKKELETPITKPTFSGKVPDAATWSRVLSYVKTKNTSIEALLRAAEPLDFDGSSLTVGVYYKFHKEKLESNQIKRILEDTVAEVLGNPVKVGFMLTEKKLEKVSEPVLTGVGDQDIISAAKEIFGQ